MGEINLIKQLEDELEEAEVEYRLGNNTKFSDKEFDLKCRELTKLYNNNIPENSILNRIVAINNNDFEKINHLIPMLSLNNTYNESDLKKWFDNINDKYSLNTEFLIQEKVDGCSLSCVYEKGKLKYIVTRGDGFTGENILCNKFIIANIPDIIPFDKTIDIRGEVYMEYDEFERINKSIIENNDTPYANPRNLTAGTIKLLDKNIIKNRSLKFKVHSIGFCEKNYNNLIEFYDDCKKWNFDVIENLICNNFNNIVNSINIIENKRKQLKYPIDGAVIKINDIHTQKILGNTSKSPKWGIAYKYEAEKAKTKIKNITLQVGRTGAITPVAELEPVYLSGSLIKRATCHNIEEMILRDIRIGDNVIIEKSGEIIPYIIEPVITDRDENIKPYTFNKKCPVCNSDAIQYNGLKHWYCSNKNCPGVLQSKMEYFVSKNCMNIEDISCGLIKKLINAGYLHTYEDFYKLDKEQLLNIERIGEKLADKIIYNIKKSLYIEPWRFLCSLGISGVGKSISKNIMNVFNNNLE